MLGRSVGAMERICKRIYELTVINGGNVRYNLVAFLWIKHRLKNGWHPLRMVNDCAIEHTLRHGVASHGEWVERFVHFSFQKCIRRNSRWQQIVMNRRYVCASAAFAVQYVRVTLHCFKYGKFIDFLHSLLSLTTIFQKFSVSSETFDGPERNHISWAKVCWYRLRWHFRIDSLWRPRRLWYRFDFIQSCSIPCMIYRTGSIRTQTHTHTSHTRRPTMSLTTFFIFRWRWEHQSTPCGAMWVFPLGKIFSFHFTENRITRNAIWAERQTSSKMCEHLQPIILFGLCHKTLRIGRETEARMWKQSRALIAI